MTDNCLLVKKADQVDIYHLVVLPYSLLAINSNSIQYETLVLSRSALRLLLSSKRPLDFPTLFGVIRAVR